MSITSVKEFFTTTGKFVGGKQHTREYSRTFLCISNDKNDATVTVYLAFKAQTGIDYGVEYTTPNEYDTYAYCQELDFSREGDDGLNWIVSAIYKPYPLGSNSDCPWLQPAKYNWSVNKMQENYDQDYDGNNVLNSSGDGFQNPLIRDRGGITLVCTQNEQTFSGSTALSVCNCINSNSFLGAAARTLKVNIGASNTWDQLWGNYWTVSYTFEYNPRTWDATVLDCGFYVLSSGKKVLALDDHNMPVNSPILLDGSGGKLDPSGTPNYITFHPYQAINFSFTLR